MTDRQSARISDIIARLETSRSEIEQLYRSFSPAELEVEVYDHGARWTVRGVLAHLITIERSMHWLFGNLRDGGDGTPESFDLERYNREQPRKLDDLTRDALLARYRDVRADTITLVREMDDAALDNVGRHPVHGVDRLERFVRWAYKHEALHAEDVRDTLEQASEAT